MSYAPRHHGGTGARRARLDFAKKFDLPIIEVVKGGDVQAAAFTDCETGVAGQLRHSRRPSVEEAKAKIIDWLDQTARSSQG
jgi:leucyl-tRNA synthetase